MTSRLLTVAAVLLSTVTLTACGQETPTTPTAEAPVVPAAPPAMEAAPPAMEAAPPAMEAAPPAMAPAPGDPIPPAGVTATLTLGDITGRWAADAAACTTEAEITTITADAFTGGGLNCTVTSATPGTAGLDVILSCMIDGAPIVEAWTITPVETAAPFNTIEIGMGGDVATLVRCP
jgi:hypothetical protein